MFLGKWKSHTRMAQPSEKFRWRRVWLVHASCIGFSPRLCSQAWKWSLRFTSMTSFLRWSMQTKWYGKSRNGVSFDRLQPTKRSTFPHAVLLRHESVVCHCFMSFGLCDKKMELRVVAIKVSRRRRKTVLVPQTNFLRLWHGKKNPWRYALKCFKTILPRTFLCLPCWQRLTFIATTRSSIFYRTIQTTWNSGTPPFHVLVVRHEEKCFFLSVAG